MFKFAGVAAASCPTTRTCSRCCATAWPAPPCWPGTSATGERRGRRPVPQDLLAALEDRDARRAGQARRPRSLAGQEAEALELGKKIYHLSGVEMDPATQQPRRPGRLQRLPPQLPPPGRAERALAAGAGQAAPAARGPAPAIAQGERVPGGRDEGQFILPTDFLFHPIKNGTTRWPSSAPSPPASAARPCPPGKGPQGRGPLGAGPLRAAARLPARHPWGRSLQQRLGASGI